MSAKKRRQTKSGQAAKKIAPWKFENEMSFLLPFLEMREVSSNLEKRGREEDDPDSEHEAVNIEVEEIEEAAQYQQPQEKETQRPPYNTPTMKSRKNQNPALEIVQIMKQNASRRMSRYEESKSKDLDETDLFYLSMAKTVKRLPALEQAKIRMTLCKLVSEAEIRNIERNYGEYSSSSIESSSSMASPPGASPTVHQSLTPSQPLFSPATPQYLSYQYQDLS